MMITLIQVKILIDTSGYTSDYILIISIIILSMYIIFTRIVMYLFIYNSIIFQNLTFLKKRITAHSHQIVDFSSNTYPKVMQIQQNHY